MLNTLSKHAPQFHNARTIVVNVNGKIIKHEQDVVTDGSGRSASTGTFIRVCWLLARIVNILIQIQNVKNQNAKIRI